MAHPKIVCRSSNWGLPGSNGLGQAGDFAHAAHDLSAHLAGSCRIRPAGQAAPVLDISLDLEKQGLPLPSVTDLGTVL